MAFLFKSSKKDKGGLPPASRGLTSSDGASTPGGGSYGPSRDGQGSRMGTQPLGGMIARGATPDQINLREQQNRANVGTPQRPPPDMSLYPWSKRRLEFASPNQSPFPRYGAASNASASAKGDVYLMGGLINGSMVKGDLWIVEANNGNMTCIPVATMAEGPGPRVGHRALLVGNAFIVFGGDTKVEEMDVLDDTLYLLNTSTRHWSRALPAGPRPAGRYGHTLNILGSKIFIFGGQVEGHFFNDLVAFDLNALQQPSNRWEILIQNSADGGPPASQLPPARTNHTIVTWNERLYLFGGTDGVRWYNDVWCYDAQRNSWSSQECIGFIPAAREGHSAALVGEVMYIFGGRTEEGKDLGDLAAFRIPTRRWYTFQNMGPSPSPRSGHCMTAHDNLIYVVGGEPSSQPEDPAELGQAYVLDTSKIRYPQDNPQQNGVRTGSRRPSVTDRSETPQQRSGSAQGAYSNGNLRLRNGSQDSVNESAAAAVRAPDGAPAQASMYGQSPPLRQQRPPGAPAPGGPMGPPPGGPPPSVPLQQQVLPQQQQPPSQPQQPQQQQSPPSQQQRGPPMMGGPPPRPFGGPEGRESPRPMNRPERLAPVNQNVPPGMDSASSIYSPRPPFPARDASSGAPGQQQSHPHAPYNHYSLANPPPGNLPGHPLAVHTTSASSQVTGIQSGVGPASRSIGAPSQSGQDGAGKSESQSSPPKNYVAQETPAVRAIGPNGQAVPVDSGLGSSPALGQHESLVKEVESLRSKTTWYSSELALARKAGYRPNSNDSQGGEERSPTVDAIEDDEKPLIESFLKMRNELINMQETLARERSSAAERVSRAEKQRDGAINEAVFLKTRLRGNGKDANTLEDRNDDAQRRLAVALNAQNDLQTKIRALNTEIESEQKARQLAEESAEIAHSRAAKLDGHKQSSSSELERLRAELHEAEKTAREATASASEHQSNAALLLVDKNELTARLNTVQSDTQTHDSVLVSLREAMTSSSEKVALLERKLDSERLERSSAQEKLAQLKAEHEARVSELETTTRRLQDAEELAASHANEAKTHRDAVLAGFGKPSERGFDGSSHADARVAALQSQLEEATANVRSNQEAADHASERLRKAEERIAGLEAYQEQASREGLSMRKQLQVASRDAVALHSEKAELQEQLTSEKMSATALAVQHNALKDLLAERGMDVNNLPVHARNRSVDSVISNERLRELEAQLESSKQAHEEMRSSFTQREAEANRGWEEKLAALDSDYQAAVKYLKGTEKMLSKMKSELHRYKNENRRLEEQMETGATSSGATAASAAWETERAELQREVESLQAKVSTDQEQLDAHAAQIQAAVAERESAQRALEDLQKQSEASTRTLREQNSQLQTRAHEAEQRVQTLLDTVGTSVANYRHSQQVNGLNPHAASASGAPAAATTAATAPAHGHSRGLSSSSAGGESSYSAGYEGPGDGRNSMALDSLASELETLRSHWETTNKNYRSSGQSVTVTTPATPSVPGAFGGPEGESLVSWRKKLEIEEREAESRRESEQSINGGVSK